MFKKVLIANRGEIALRVIRACKELGIRTVAVHSEVDRNSLHVRFADEAVCIGKNNSQDSYLNIPAVMSAAEITDVDAIHPGYGFLSENPHFSEICDSCDVTFIGPSAHTVRHLGDKSKAKEIMKSEGVPVVPGSEGVIETEKEALEVAESIGYPVIIKASFGGGGRGMRIAYDNASLATAFLTAKGEAEKAFTSGEVYLEKLIENPRHIEIQFIADNHGNCVHLGERDCTIQRRHQKLLEEAPSPVMTESKRREIGALAVKGVMATGYRNAGTMEFLMDKNGKFYFMEVNTRIQVEHPVTEIVTGIDLVKEQILVAMGNTLSFSQKDISIKGSAIECRINAEDPFNDFMPSPGTIDGYNVPGGLGVRIDTHAYEGYSISPYYDSMIGKLIVTGKNREEALAVLKRALSEYIIQGIHTTIPFFEKLIQDPNFINLDYDTGFMDDFQMDKSKK
ncbi:acetyl-CoA carboxylase biotin carboxylase subunit [PVC group bacterium (ex Bugula neritina AB1)]|nr:acetyl-CoA carboxylase biotin carboxylase subunit [PVC group bacterium (ex Bugula neritina AB1)]